MLTIWGKWKRKTWKRQKIGKYGRGLLRRQKHSHLKCRAFRWLCSTTWYQYPLSLFWLVLSPTVSRKPPIVSVFLVIGVISSTTSHCKSKLWWRLNRRGGKIPPCEGINWIYHFPSLHSEIKKRITVSCFVRFSFRFVALLSKI